MGRAVKSAAPIAWRLPDFIVVGPPRTATSWLDQALRRQVGLPERTKETFFFARNYGRGLRWYGQQFEHCRDEPVVGEICAAYFENAESVERIYKHIPTCKIVCTLRDPVDRLYSYYKLMRHNGVTGLPFDRAIEIHQNMIEHSRYASILHRWLDRFGDGQVLVVLNDDLQADPQAYVDRITDFIGVGRVVVRERLMDRRQVNAIDTAPRSVLAARGARRLRNWLGAHRLYGVRRWLRRAGIWRLFFEGGQPFPPLDEATRTRLRTMLRPEIEALERMIGRDLSAWKGVG